MIKKIVTVPVKAAKGTFKAASWLYKLATGALLGAAIYKGVQKTIEARSVPDELPPLSESIPEAPTPKAKRKKPVKKKKAVKKKSVKRKPVKKPVRKKTAKKKTSGKRKAKKK